MLSAQTAMEMDREGEQGEETVPSDRLMIWKLARTHTLCKPLLPLLLGLPTHLQEACHQTNTLMCWYKEPHVLQSVIARSIGFGCCF